MQKLSTITLSMTLGLIMTVGTAGAGELKPSQVKSLESTLGRVDKIELVLDEQNPTNDMDEIKVRIRELTNAQKSLKRLTRTLSRLPDVAAVKKGIARVEKLDAKLTQKIANVEGSKNSIESSQSAEIDSLNAMVASDEFKSDFLKIDILIDELEQIGDHLSGSWLVGSENGDAVDEALLTVKRADEILAETDRFLNKYGKHKMSSRVIGLTAAVIKVQDLKRRKEYVLKSKPVFLQKFPEAQEEAIEVLRKDLDHIMKTNYNKDMFTTGATNKTNIQGVRAKVVNQAKLYDAINGPLNKEIQAMTKKSMAYWDKVKNETDYDIYLKNKAEYHDSNWIAGGGKKKDDD